MNPKPKSHSHGTFPLSLNTSTIRGARLPLSEELKIAAKAGFTGVEPWINEIEEHVAKGGTLAGLRRQIQDLGLQVVGAVGFAEWIVEEEHERAAGFEQLKRDMHLVSEIGGKFIAAPPAGAQLAQHCKPSLEKAAERYAEILDLGEKMGVTPALELWGFSHFLSELSEVVHVAIAANHPRACLLLDSYHLYKGGSGFDALRLLNGAALPVFHINDYPGHPARAQIDDSHRVYPGDGVAPLVQILNTFGQIGFAGFLSVELFNPEYWKQPAADVAREAFRKTTGVVASSGIN